MMAGRRFSVSDRWMRWRGEGGGYGEGYGGGRGGVMDRWMKLCRLLRRVYE
jgi:hypothetical protein